MVKAREIVGDQNAVPAQHARQQVLHASLLHQGLATAQVLIHLDRDQHRGSVLVVEDQDPHGVDLTHSGDFSQRFAHFFRELESPGGQAF